MQKLLSVKWFREIAITCINSISVWFPPEFRSNKIAKANYERQRYHAAHKRLNGDALLEIKIEYKLACSGAHELREYYGSKWKEIEKRISILPYDLIFDYLVFIRNDDIAVLRVLKSLCKRPNRNRSVFTVLSLSYLRGEAPKLDAKCQVDKILNMFFHLEKHVLRTTGVLPHLADSDFFKTALKRHKLEASALAPYLHQYVKPKKKKLLIKFLKTNPSYAGAVLQSDFDYLKEELGRKELLRLVKNTNSPSLYVQYYPKLFSFEIAPFLTWLFYKEDYNKIERIVSAGAAIGCYRFIDKCLYFVYLSLVESNPKFAIEYFDKRSRKGLGVSSYLVLNSLYQGKVRGAEIERTRIDTSLQNYLDTTYGAVTESNIREATRYFIVAEQGVADEVRWARLYSILNIDERAKFTITCDPRLYNIFSLSFPNIDFVAHKRHFRRGRGMTNSLFHSLNIPDISCEYDLVMSTSLLHCYCKDIRTNNRAYLIPKSDGRKLPETAGLKIGILWSSSLAVGLRKERFGISRDIFSEFVGAARKLGSTIYCLQSPLSLSDLEYCKENNIFIEDSVDLYNDFDTSAEFLSQLDFIVGPSSLVTELSAACGATFLHISNSPETTMMRNGSLNRMTTRDQLSNRTLTMFPKIGYNHTKKTVNRSCLEHALAMIEKRIDDRSEAFLQSVGP